MLIACLVCIDHTYETCEKQRFLNGDIIQEKVWFDASAP